MGEGQLPALASPPDPPIVAKLVQLAGFAKPYVLDIHDFERHPNLCALAGHATSSARDPVNKMSEIGHPRRILDILPKTTGRDHRNAPD